MEGASAARWTNPPGMVSPTGQLLKQHEDETASWNRRLFECMLREGGGGGGGGGEEVNLELFIY